MGMQVCTVKQEEHYDRMYLGKLQGQSMKMAARRSATVLQ